jgi:hypothetical protein
MTKSRDSYVALSSTAKHGGGKWLYPLLLTVQTGGAVLLCWQVLPTYRNALANPTGYDSQTTVSSLGAGMLIQVAYWIRYRLRPPPPGVVNVALGHVVLFLSRLIFLVPSTVFSFLFISKTLQAQLPIRRYVVILFGLFSLFCYVRELERLGTRLLGTPEK